MTFFVFTHVNSEQMKVTRYLFSNPYRIKSQKKTPSICQLMFKKLLVVIKNNRVLHFDLLQINNQLFSSQDNNWGQTISLINLFLDIPRAV